MNKYVFKPYDPRFPFLFEKEQQRIEPYLYSGVVIEHVGSTAVPNLSGKGIIDIAVGAHRSLFLPLKQVLQGLGYEFRERGSTKNRWFFKIDLQDEQEPFITYHVHLTCLPSEEWNQLISFRDYLRRHPQVAMEYSEIKVQAVEEAKGVGQKYRDVKAPFLRMTLGKILGS